MQSGGRVDARGSSRRAAGQQLARTQSREAAKERAIAMRVSLEFEGLSQVDAALEALPDAVRLRVLRKTMKKSAEPILSAAKAKVPVGAGKLRDSLVIRAARKKKRSTKLRVSVLPGNDWFKGDTYYAGFLEFGFLKQQAYLGRDGKWHSYKRGKGIVKAIEPRPFLRPALEESKSAVMAIFTQEIPRDVAAAAARLARQKLKSQNIKIERLNKRRIRRMDGGA